MERQLEREVKKDFSLRETFQEGSGGTQSNEKQKRVKVLKGE